MHSLGNSLQQSLAFVLDQIQSMDIHNDIADIADGSQNGTSDTPDLKEMGIKRKLNFILGASGKSMTNWWRVNAQLSRNIQSWVGN